MFFDLRALATDKASVDICSLWIGAAFLLGLTLCMFGGVLFTSRPFVLSDGKEDLAKQFIYWRAFTAEQLRQGHLPLWNPHVYCGMPYLGWAQTAVLYPTNWLDLVLPLPSSINLGIMLHVYLAGLFTYLWGLRRGLRPVPAVVAGVLFMFSSSYFLHVHDGHPSLLYAIAWTPLVFLSVDEWTQARTPGWVLAGMAAIAMQIFAGDFQACFYTAVAAGLLMLVRLIDVPCRVTVLAGFFGMYAGAASLGAAQLLPTFQAASESDRSGGVSYHFASMFSFPPENLLTALAPGFFGNGISAPYWGRWLWEGMCLFVGVSGLTLAVYGAVCGKRELRRGLIPLLGITLVLALGMHTPLLTILYNWVPGFDQFRANGRFIIEGSLFMVMLAGVGLDGFLTGPKGNKCLALGLVIASIIAGAAGLQLRSAALSLEPANWWFRTIQAVHATHESLLPAASYADPMFVRQAGEFSSRCLFVAAAELLVMSGLALYAGASRRVGYAVALMAIAEVFVFARASLATFDPSSVESPKLKTFFDQHPGDYRIFYPEMPNVAMWLGKEDIGGYAPLMLKRYAEFMAFTQGHPPEGANQYVVFHQFRLLYHPLYTMLRWQYAFTTSKDGDRVLTGKPVMPHLQLVQEYSVLSRRDQILQAMDSPSFDPRQQVILETDPNPAPQRFAEKGTAVIVDSSVNELTVEADLPHPAIMLITDAYSDGWRARPLDSSVQHTYDVLPANYILRAIPLSQGHHHIRIEYAPVGFRVGKWISIVTLAGFVFATALYARSLCSWGKNSPAQSGSRLFIMQL